jgi:hypothetical protein
MKKTNVSFKLYVSNVFSFILLFFVTLSLIINPIAATRANAAKHPNAESKITAQPSDNLIPSTVFSNPAAIAVPDNNGPSAQSNITVSGTSGPISSLTLTLTGLNATGNAFIDDLDMLLVGPGGQKFVFLSDIGGFFSNSNGTINLTLSDAAGSFAPSAGNVSSGTFKPTNNEALGDVFNAPAPAGPYSTAGPAGAGDTFTSVFGGLSGASVNGTWSLFIEDDASTGASANITGGWSLDIVTTPAALPTTTGIISSLNPSFRNQAVTFTSTTTSSAAVNTGVVNFVDNTTATTLCANVPVNGSGVATCTANANTLTERTHVVQATYVGNATFSTSNASLTQTVNCPVTGVSPTFTNGCGITIPDAGGTAIPYPSNLVVSGLSGSISKVTLTLTNVNFPKTDDHNFLLVGPNGDKYLFWSDAGGGVATTGQTITLDDAAATQLPNSGSIATGTYRPADYAQDSEIFPPPAPAAPYPSAPPNVSGATFASVFGGDAPNGTWSLYSHDDTGSANSSTIGSWSLTFTTSGDAATTTVLTSNPNPSTTVQPFVLTATVTSTSTVNAGTVTFRRSATILCANVPVVSGVATCNQPAYTQGDYVLTADYNGSPGAFNISSGSVTQQVNSPTVKTGQNFANNGGITIPNSSPSSPYPSRIIVAGLGGTISKVTLSLNGINAPALDHVDFLLVGPGGQKFQFLSDAGGTTPISGVNITLDDAAATQVPDNTAVVSGTYRPASYSGDSDIFPAPAPAGPYNPAAPDGTGTFANLFNGIVPNGTWSLYAFEDTGDALNTTLSGWSLTFTLTPVATTTGVTSSADPSVFGQTVTFTATVSTAGLGTPTGTVQFFDGPNPIGGAVTLNASGQATLMTSALSVGDHTITAQYAGDVPNGFNASTGALATNPQTVNKANTTAGLASNQANPVGTGIPVTYTATISPVAPGAGTRTGSVTFFRNGSPICSNVPVNVSGQATCTITFSLAGSYNITAQYSGDANFNTSSSPTFVQSVVGPTAANVSVEGRILSQETGRAVYNARVVMTDSNGQTRIVRTNPFGYYRFTEVASGAIYTFTVSAKGYATSDGIVRNITENVTDLNISLERQE